MRTKFLAVLISVLPLLTFGCKEKEPEITESEVTMKINFRYGSQPLVYDQEYTYDTDKKIKIELVKFYISKPALRNAAGDWVPFGSEYFLVDLGHPTFSAGKMPVGNYSAIRFGVGVDNSRNIQSDPQAIPATDYPNDHPLNAASDMYWSWATGYIFVKVEGRIDANNNGSYIDVEDKTVSYHPGVPELFRSIQLEKSITVGSEAVQPELTLNVEALFTGIDLIARPYAHPNGVNHPEYGNAVQMMDQFQTAFE